jgi:hypothetical protein
MGIKAIENIYRSLDVITVVLLLTGQIAISGVFMTTDAGFSLSLSGPITGGARSISDETHPFGNDVIDAIDIFAAILLILNQINVIGTFVSAHRFTIVVSGPFFGEPKRVAYSPEASRFISSYRYTILRKCKIEK